MIETVDSISRWSQNYYSHKYEIIIMYSPNSFVCAPSAPIASVPFLAELVNASLIQNKNAGSSPAESVFWN